MLNPPENLALTVLRDHYAERSNPYADCIIPTDNTLKEYLNLLRKKQFQEAVNLLAKHYEIPSPTLTINNELPVAYIFYDFRVKTIFISPQKIPQLWQQVPALLLGFFNHLAEWESWTFDKEPDESRKKEKMEAEKFAQLIVRRLIDIGLNPMEMS